MILTLTIRSQVCATYSRISLRANKDLFEYLSQTLAAQPTLYHLYIREERLHLALDIETLRALTVKFARYQPRRFSPSMDDRVSRRGTQVKIPYRQDFRQTDVVKSVFWANRGAKERGPANGAALLVPTDYNRLVELVTAPAIRAMNCHSWIRRRSPPSWPAFLLLLPLSDPLSFSLPLLLRAIASPFPSSARKEAE